MNCPDGRVKDGYYNYKTKESAEMSKINDSTVCVMEKTDEKNGVYLVIKRILDVICALCGLILLSPLFLGIAIAIKIDSKGPVFFKHNRIGKNGKPLGLYKFRSMYENAEDMIRNFTPEQKREWKENYKLDHDPRITKVGDFLRKSSLDELPQLLNIIKGELSIVGPRPVIQEELEKYGKNKEKFLSVTPGLTGYWQAYARSDVDYDKRMQMELYYVDNASFWWDIKIIFATFGAVLKGKGAK